MNAVRCPPADQPVTMIGPVIPCSALFALSQSNAVRISLVICVRLASGASVYPGRAADQPRADGPSARQANTSLLLRCQ